MAQIYDQLTGGRVAGRVACGAVSLVFVGSLLFAGGCAQSASSQCTGCNGCCLNGQCVQGDDPAACGQGGQDCQTCASGASCVNGECQAAVTCGPGTCAGCCSGDQCVLVGMQSDGVCGAGGAVCQPCGTGPCVNGQCQSQSCTVSTCSGCCNSAGQCLQPPQQSAAQCGSGGIRCQACSGQECVNGQCTTPTCTSSNCTGCCGAGGCVQVAQQGSAACGVGGAPCAPCASPALCANGICSGGACNPSSCGGCCQGSQCIAIANQSQSACGIGGAACHACSGTTPTCSGGACQGCSAASCAAGCCQGALCVKMEQQSASACGKGGGQCAACTGANESCLDGLCKVAWKVLATSAQLLNKPSGDWDENYVPGGGPEPDPILECTATTSGKSGSSPYVNNTLTPIWGNALLFVEVEANLTGGLTCDVYDDDSFIIANREHMGQCTFASLAPLTAGARTSTTCTSSVTSVTITLARN